MDEMTQQNAALVEEAAASSKSMEEQAQLLLEQIAFFTQETVEERTPIRHQSRAVNGGSINKRPKPKLSAVEETPRPIFKERAKANLVNSDQEWEEF
jgi:methyl-accepting chemotaxis protein